jgi:hypothetical protein
MLQSVGIDMLNVSTLETPLQDPSVTDSGHTACLLPLGSWPVLRHWIRCVQFRKRRSTRTHGRARTHTRKHTHTRNSTMWDWVCVKMSQKKTLHISKTRHPHCCLQITSTWIKVVKQITGCLFIYSRLNVSVLFGRYYWGFKKPWYRKNYMMNKNEFSFFILKMHYKYIKEL